MAGLLLFLPLLLMPAIGVFAMNRSNQRTRDRERRSYKLSFSSTMSEERVLNLLRAISGGRSSNTIAAELWSSDEFAFRLKVPWRSEAFMNQLREQVPDLRYEHEVDPPRKSWTHAVELKMTSPGRPLRIYPSTGKALRANMSGLNPGETVMVQTVFRPARHSRKPLLGDTTDRFTVRSIMGTVQASKDEIADRRAKLEEPVFEAVIRIAAKAETPARAKHLISLVRQSLGSTATEGTRFRDRPTLRDKLQLRIDNPATPMMFPMLLNAKELTALLGWPTEGIATAGMPAFRSRILPAPVTVPDRGRLLGFSNQPHNERPICMPYERGVYHFMTTSGTGAGKTTLLTNMLYQDIQNGYGAIVVETKGDLFYSALNLIPKHRLEDVVILDISDWQHPVGFNVLNQGNPRAAVDRIINLFAHLYGGERGLWLRGALFHGISTLVTDPKYTLADLVPLLDPRTPDDVVWSDTLIRTLPPDLKDYFTRKENKNQRDFDRVLQPTIDRTWEINARPELRNILGQSKTSIDLLDVVMNNKILLCNFGTDSKDASQIISSLFLMSLWDVVQRNRPEKPNFLYADEVQTLMGLPVDFNDMFAKARSMNLGINVANQFTDQLPKQILAGLMQNAGTQLVFQLNSASEASTFKRQFGDSVSEQDFTSLGAYEALARIYTKDGISTPVSLTTAPPPKGFGLGQEAIELSRHKYATPIALVDEDIATRRQAPPSGPRPKIGSVGD